MILPRQLQQEDQALRVFWSDDHECVYPYGYLRDKCPCAVCRARGPGGERAGEGERCGTSCGCHSGPALSPPAGGGPRLEEIHMVGRYALQFVWQDSHATGLYPFDFLRDLCPCPSCVDRPKVPQP